MTDSSLDSLSVYNRWPIDYWTAKPTKDHLVKVSISNV